MELNEKKLSKYIDQLNKERQPDEHKKSDKFTDDEQLMDTVRRVRRLREPVMPEDDFERRLITSIKGTNTTKVFERLEARKANKNFSRRRNSIIGITLVAAAACLLFLITNILPVHDNNIAYAMEEAIKEVKAYHGIIEVTQSNEAGEQMLQSRREVWADQKGDYYLKELEGYAKGTITVNDRRKEWQIRPDEKKVYLSDAFPDLYRFTFELGNEVENVENALEVKQIGEEKISGRDALIFKVTPKGGDSYKLWVDKETKMPLRRQTAMQNAVQITISYTELEFEDKIPEELMHYQVPKGFEVTDLNPEQIVADLEEAGEIAGFIPKLPEPITNGFNLQGIAVLTDTSTVKASYLTVDRKKSVVILQTKSEGELKTTNAELGSVNGSKAEFLNNYQGVAGVNSIRWMKNNMEYTVYGNIDMDMLSDFVKGLSKGEVKLPEQKETETKPVVEVPVDLTVEKNDQKSVDAGNSPWKLDPVFVAHVFANLLISPKGITGEYPIPYEDVSLISNSGKEAVVKINNKKSIAGKVYLKRLIREDDTGIWTVVGYDPAKNK